MTDIVEQLRTVDTQKTDAWAICEEAADEIERLRKMINNIVVAYNKANPMRTADWHGEDCDCLRCAIDNAELRELIRTELGEGK